MPTLFPQPITTHPSSNLQQNTPQLLIHTSSELVNDILASINVNLEHLVNPSNAASKQVNDLLTVVAVARADIQIVGSNAFAVYTLLEANKKSDVL